MTPSSSTTESAIPPAHLFTNTVPLVFMRRVLSRYAIPTLPETFADPPFNDFRDHYSLSEREGQVLDLLLKGKSNRDIEGELFISPHRVRNHIYNAYQKLGVSSRLQLMNLVREWMESGPASS